MKKNFIAGIIVGGLLFGSVGVFAGQYIATDNPFPVQLNGNDISIEGYNIEGSTYFKLRDIADTVGGFSVDFNNDTIQLSKDGYTYNNTQTQKDIVYYAEEKFSFLPDYGAVNNVDTTDFLEYNDGSAYYYIYEYDQTQVDNYINYLRELGYTVYNQPTDLLYSYKGSDNIYLSAGTPVIEYNGKYASLDKNDNVNCLQLTVYGDKTPEQGALKAQNFVDTFMK